MNYAEYINKVGLTSHKCVVCNKNLTNPGYFASMKKYNQPVCFSCNKLLGESVENLNKYLSEKTISSTSGEQSPDASV